MTVITNEILSKAGIFQVKNLVNGNKYLNISANLAVTYNRLNFLLKIGAYDNKELQADFNSYGINNLCFEVMDYIEIEDANYNPENLELLFEIWQLRQNSKLKGNISQ